MQIAAPVNTALRKVPAWPIYAIGSVYIGYQFYLAATGQMGPEPINALEREYGEVGLILLIVGLTVTPLRNWTGINLIKFRRALGIVTFVIVLAHFLVFAILDVQSLGRVVTEVIKRPYVTVGMLSFVLLIPLALTSNNWSIRKMGPVKWRNLHKLVYPITLLAGVHYLWLVKGFQIEPIIYLAIIVGLLAVRYVRRTTARAAAPARG